MFILRNCWVKKITTFGVFFGLCLNLTGMVSLAAPDVQVDDWTTEEDLYLQIDGRQNPQDLYLSIYNSVKKTTDQEAYKRLTKQSNFSAAEVRAALSGNFTEDFQKSCEEWLPSKTSQSLYECLNILKENYEFEKQLFAFENNLKGTVEASEIWSDGNLSNSFFDLIVDLQIIEIILFGESSYEYPYTLKLTEADGWGTEDLSISGEDGGSGVVLIEPSDGASGTSTGDVVLTNVCQDPEALVLKVKNWSIAQTNQTKQISPKLAKNQAAYRGGEFQLPENNDDCGDPDSRFYRSGGVSLFHGLLCTEPWPCDNVFCIRVSEVIQEVAENSQKDPPDLKSSSVQGMVKTGINQLNQLKGHTLTVKENSNERFFPSVGKFFTQKLGLDVIMQNIPIKLSAENKGTAFDKEVDLEKDFQEILCEELRLDCKENGDIVIKEAQRTITQQTEGGELQTTTWTKVLTNDEQLRESYDAIKATWLQSKKTEYRQAFWEEFKKYLNLTALYFQSMEEIFGKLQTSGAEILDNSGQSCKN